MNFIDWKWLCYHLGSLSLSYIQSFYLALGALYLFVPIMGRIGNSINSEVIMAIMLAVLFCELLSFTVKINSSLIGANFWNFIFLQTSLVSYNIM